MVIKQVAITGIKGFKCTRCIHIWQGRKRDGKDHIPMVCPKCKSPYWNIPRVMKKQGKEKNLIN